MTGTLPDGGGKEGVTGGAPGTVVGVVGVTGGATGTVVGVVAGLVTGTGENVGFVGGEGKFVVGVTVAGTAAGFVGEIVTGFVEGTAMMVGVLSGGVMIGVVGFVGKTVFVGLFVSSKVLLLRKFLDISSLLSSFSAKSSVVCISAYNAAIFSLASRYLDTLSLN